MSICPKCNRYENPGCTEEPCPRKVRFPTGTFIPAPMDHYCAVHKTVSANSDHCIECEQDTRTVTIAQGRNAGTFNLVPGDPEPFPRGNSRAITYTDDGIEIRVTLPLKPGALKFARGFLEQLLRDSGNT